MERVAFLIEATGERIPCLLNPESVVVRRLAGVRARTSSSGPLTGTTLKDDPVLYTGGGTTELLLDLLFDVSLIPDEPPVEDVRDLTKPLTTLAEGNSELTGSDQVPKVRFVWGKSWNVLGVVTALAERLEYFTSGGAPQRSWLRMRFLRIADDAATADDDTEDLRPEDVPDESDIPSEELDSHQVMGGGDAEDEGGAAERLDEIAAARYGNASYWRLIAAFNNIDDPWETTPGQVLKLPPESVLGADS